MFCGKCGNKLKEGSNFCTSCGAPIESNINNTINSINNSNYTNNNSNMNNSNYTNNSNNMNNSNYTNNSNNINNNTQKNGKKGVLKGLMVAGIVISIFIVIEVGTRLIEHGVDKLTEKTQNNSKTSSNKSNNNYGGNNNTNNNNNNVNNNNNNYGGSTNKTTQKIGSSKTGYLTIPSSYEADSFNTEEEMSYTNENGNLISFRVSKSIFAEDKESLKEGVISDAKAMDASTSSVTETTVNGMIGFKYKTYDSQRNIWYGYWELLDNSKDNIIYSIRIYANSQNDEIFNAVNTFSKN